MVKARRKAHVRRTQKGKTAQVRQHEIKRKEQQMEAFRHIKGLKRGGLFDILPKLVIALGGLRKFYSNDDKYIRDVSFLKKGKLDKMDSSSVRNAGIKGYKYVIVNAGTAYDKDFMRKVGIVLALARAIEIAKK